MDIYRGMDRPTLDRAYNNSAAVPNSAELMAGFARRSTAVYDSFDVKRDLAYGEGARQRLDWIPGPIVGAPTFAFIHGGYWQFRAKEDFAFVAAGPLARGFNVALIEYTLGPTARLGQIVDEIGQAVDFLASCLADWGADRRRLCLAGHSAGGHLVACHRAHPAVTLALGISGIYELEPIQLCYLNDKLDLSPGEVAEHSPARHIGAGARTLLTVGTDELPELVRQTEEYAALQHAGGQSAELIPAPGHDHFTVLETIALPDGAALEAVAQAFS
jgi:arylformamidase